MDNIDDILYSPISSEPETETQDGEPVNIENDVNTTAPLTLAGFAAQYPCLNWQMPTSQLQQNLSQNYRQLNQPIHNFNQQAAQTSLQQWAAEGSNGVRQNFVATQNQTLSGLMSSQPLLSQLASQQAAQQTLEMVISDWWINTSLHNEE